MDMIELPSPQALKLLRILTAAIDAGWIQEGRPESFPSYSTLLRLLGSESPITYAGRRLKVLGLNELNEWTEQHEELPKITALIVNKDTRRPSESFAQRYGRKSTDPDYEAWWLKEANRAIRHDWSAYTVDIPANDLDDGRALQACLNEDEDDYSATIVTIPPPARIRATNIPVGQVLRWLADGQSEQEILHGHPELRKEDIRASLAFAADRELGSTPTTTQSFSSRWIGKIPMPKPDTDDVRLIRIIKRYERNAK